MTIAELIADYDGWPTSPDQANDAYSRGRADGPTFLEVTIAVNNVWGADCRDGGTLSSYERIGYHAGSVDFIRGVLDSGCPVRVYRNGWQQLERE